MYMYMYVYTGMEVDNVACNLKSSVTYPQCGELNCLHCEEPSALYVHVHTVGMINLHKQAINQASKQVYIQLLQCDQAVQKAPAENAK